MSAAGWDDERRQLLTAGAGDLAGVALANVVREYPHCEFHWQIEGEHIPTPRRLHPSFYGSLDWHSCVEMFWVLVRLLRCHPDLVPGAEIRRTLNEHLTAPALAAEAALFTPATVTDPSDGLIAHLHGLNLHRAWCWQRLALAVPADDDRIVAMLSATRGHTHASLLQSTDSVYGVEHFLAYYALRLLS